MRRFLLFCLLPSALCLLLSCASTPPPLVAPEWNAIPAGVIDTFCLRLRAEGLAEGPVTIVNTTQRIATMRHLTALAGPRPSKVDPQRAAEALHGAQRTIPVMLTQSECRWVAVDAANAYRRHDQMIMELSAPMANPFEPGTAGIFVRVSVAGEHGSWYWISLIPRGGDWVVGFIRAIPS